jgi:ribosome-interacting GTPase 1
MLSGKNVKIAEYKYTTSEPVHKMITFENVKIQGIEVPGIYKGFYNSKNGRQYLSVVRNVDVAIVLANSKADFDMIYSELEKANIILTKTRERAEGFEVRIPYIKLSRNKFSTKLIPKLWKMMGKIRVQTKTDGKIAPNPIVLTKGSTVEDVARMIHQDFVRKFRYAKIEGSSAKFKGQQVGLEHKCKDGDIVEVFVK